MQKSDTIRSEIEHSVAMDAFVWIKPIFTTYVFEMKKLWKKFIVFAVLAVSFVFLLSCLPYLLIQNDPLPENQIAYVEDGLGFLTMIVIFSSCFFFGGIICSEFSEKTGHIVFPIINRYKILTGKFLAEFTLLALVIAMFYFSLAYLGIIFYGTLIIDKILLSYFIALLYGLAVGSLVTLFSSFLRSVSMTIVFSIMMILIANMIVDQLISLWLPDFEPVYSLNHMSKLISYIMNSNFPTKLSERYSDRTFGGEGRGGPAGSITFRTWLTPSIAGGIGIALGYTIVCLTLAILIFRRKQL